MLRLWRVIVDGDRDAATFVEAVDLDNVLLVIGQVDILYLGIYFLSLKTGAHVKGDTHSTCRW